MEKFISNAIYFIAEQDGDSENEFKSLISDMLVKHTNRVRAYLCRIKFDLADNNESVALCFATATGEDEYLLREATEIFKSLFNSQSSLYILFLSEANEHALRIVFLPFYMSYDYQINIPDFYLSSGDSMDFQGPYQCFKRHRFVGENPYGYLLCDIEPPIIGQKYGLGGEDIHQVILVSRWQNQSIFPITEWPAHVYLTLPLVKNIESKSELKTSDLSLLAWVEIYQSEDDIPERNLQT